MRAVASCRAATTAGFTLIEVLIALAILAVGLLGGVALLIEGLRASRSACGDHQSDRTTASLGTQFVRRATELLVTCAPLRHVAPR